jgi:hypothetical protein
MQLSIPGYGKSFSFYAFKNGNFSAENLRINSTKKKTPELYILVFL